MLNNFSAKTYDLQKRNLLDSPNLTNALLKSPSLKPFPVVNNEFFQENKNLLWKNQADINKIEISLMRANSSRKYLDNDMFIFNKVKN